MDFPRHHFETPEEARGVTDPGVGSGALFGSMVNGTEGVEQRTGLIANHFCLHADLRISLQHQQQERARAFEVGLPIRVLDRHKSVDAKASPAQQTFTHPSTIGGEFGALDFEIPLVKVAI
jgi:hypothetical protein